ncbi:DEKNAAC101020 [Brettanomyces naardenensis]|uniref:Mitogen-activated protein kinase n=1 Tax=Brettanomyces naardenensis TaxID=13370 RepID=A0A448YGY9_BRENA|nr:DEKNAAC101020 [Brettanomyces naardenensis]
MEYTFNLRDYSVKEILGQGAYGIVALGYHRRSGKTVAIKKIEPFQRTLFCIRTLREIKFLKQFNHPNIIRIVEIQKPSSFDSFKEVYVVQEYMDADLHSVIRTQVLSDDHIKYFLYQILKGVKYLHSCGVIHRDLKPANLLVNENCDLKICDFGLARIETDQMEDKVSFLTEYVATRWYRAPEIMLSSSQYSKAIDIWSVGCIVAEMILREPFLPGTDYRNQLALIFEVLGTPEVEEMKCIKLKRAKEYVMSQKARRKIPMRRIFGTANSMAVDFIEKTVCFDPAKRLTAEQALEHAYVKDFREPREEVVAEEFPKDFFFFDKYKEQLRMVDLKRMLYAEIVAG